MKKICTLILLIAVALNCTGCAGAAGYAAASLYSVASNALTDKAATPHDINGTLDQVKAVQEKIKKQAQDAQHAVSAPQKKD